MWQFSFSKGKDEKQFAIVSVERGKFLVGNEERSGTIIPALFYSSVSGSYVELVHKIRDGKHRVWPFAVL